MKKTIKKAGALGIAALLTLAFAPIAAFADDDDKKKDKPKKGKKDRFTQMDANKDGKVDLAEFTAAAKKRKKPATDEQAAKQFKRLDKDKSDSLSKDEVAGGGKKKKKKDGDAGDKKKKDGDKDA